MSRRSGEPKSWLEQITFQRIHVHTTEDATVEGVLSLTTPDGIVLRAARLHAHDSRPVDMAGEVWIPRERIAFVQNTTNTIPEGDQQ